MKEFMKMLDLPVAVLRKEIEEMPWPRAKEIYSKFESRSRGYQVCEHDKEVAELLYRRMCTIELPQFQPTDETRVIRVANQVSNGAIKCIVAELMGESRKPKFVVEKNGNLRGFALSASLIIAGTAYEFEKAFEIAKRALDAEYLLPTSEDCQVIEQHWAELSEMMDEAKVPDLENAEMLLLASPIGENLSYPVWQHKECQASRVDWDDWAKFMAKL